MQQQRISGAEPATGLDEESMDNAIVSVMLSGDPWPWSLDELGRELGAQVDARDAVARLAAAGLVHTLGAFVFPTRAARRAAHLHIGTL